MRKFFLKFFIRLVPLNYMSMIVGTVMRIPLPQPLSLFMIKIFAKVFVINIEEAEQPLTKYHSLSQFFSRALKAGLRPIGDGLIHPADAVQEMSGQVFEGVLLQAKRKAYTIEELTGNICSRQQFAGGYYLTYYLCPADYHRVHSPLAGKIMSAVHIPGQLWPVNGWAVKSITRLFAVNERLVINLTTGEGLVTVIMVGATNVGRITASFDATILGNSGFAKNIPQIYAYDPQLPVIKGQELGIFNLGSTVIVLYSREFAISEAALNYRGQVKMGQPLLK